VTTAAGVVPVRASRVNDKRIDEATGERKRFASSILPAWSRKSPRVAEVLPLLCLHGLSPSDFGAALEQFLGSGAGCPRQIPRHPQTPCGARDSMQRRDLRFSCVLPAHGSGSDGMPLRNGGKLISW
jgi:hypothetical protein